MCINYYSYLTFYVFISAKLVCYLLAIGECRYVNLASDLQRVNLFELTPDEKLAFFLNLYNAMVIHAIIRVGHPEGVIDRKSFFSDFQYVVGGYPYSLSTIKNGILRNNRRDTYSLAKPFGSGDKRLEVNLLFLVIFMNAGEQSSCA